MKLFILSLLFLTFNCFAGYAPDCASVKKGFYRDKKSCEDITLESCYLSPVGLNCEIHSLFDEYIDDYDSPIYEAESNNIMCVDQETCEAELLNLVCPSLEHIKIIELNYSQVYCTKLLGYDQKLSGNKIVKEDPVKKAAFDIVEQDKKDKEKDDKDAKDLAKDYFITIDCLTLKAGFEQNACEYLKR